ncbi:hypothetical protein BBJ28_00023159 [Nothophytophthora sp. Chile5]|nr:hypothetical protein BBJ28_00023159 [Nothophytophthora sp. Chile5]
MIMYKFDPPPSKSDLVDSLHSCNNNARMAYNLLMAARQDPTTCLTTDSATTLRSGAKQRLKDAPDSADDVNTKRIKSAGGDMRHIKDDEVSTEIASVVPKDRGDTLCAGENALVTAEKARETSSLQLLKFVKQKHAARISTGETDAFATLEATMEVWEANDPEIRSLWEVRHESTTQIKSCRMNLSEAKCDLRFHQSLNAFFSRAHEWQEEVLNIIAERFDEIRAATEQHVMRVLVTYIPMLTSALSWYYELYSIQQAKASEELEKQETLLAAHVEYFGDSAPIKKTEIERAACEFECMMHSGVKEFTETMKFQQKLWKQIDLPEPVNQTAVSEFKLLGKKLEGQTREIVSALVTALEVKVSVASEVSVKVLEDGSTTVNMTSDVDTAELKGNTSCTFMQNAFHDVAGRYSKS